MEAEYIKNKELINNGFNSLISNKEVVVNLDTIISK